MLVIAGGSFSRVFLSVCSFKTRFAQSLCAILVVLLELRHAEENKSEVAPPKVFLHFKSAPVPLSLVRSFEACSAVLVSVEVFLFVHSFCFLFPPLPRISRSRLGGEKS